MDEGVKLEVNLVNTCHGCLSCDRKISPLGENSEMLVSLLGSHRACLVYGIEDIKLCWECMRILKKFKSFQEQLKKAQAGLMKMLYEIDSHAGTLSKLTIVNKYYYDQDIKHLSKTKLKKNLIQLDSIAVIKTEFEDIRSHSDDDDDRFDDIDSKSDTLDANTDSLESKTDALECKSDALESKTDAHSNKNHALVNINDALVNINDALVNKNDDHVSKNDALEGKVLGLTNELLEVELSYVVKEEVKPEVEVKEKKTRRRKDTKCVNNVVGYYKRYATLIKTEKKDWGSWETVRGYFKMVEFSEKEMEDHFFTKDRRNTSYQRLPHKCRLCTLGYTREDDLKRHNDLNHHKERASYKCSLCNKKQSSHSALESHWRSHSRVYRCTICSDVCKENFMRKHLDHAHTRIYGCTVCRMEFGTLKIFTIHYKEMHMTYVCDYCDHTLTTKKKMEKHISEHHMVYTCKDCNRPYKNYIYYKKHCYALHPDKVKSKNDPELSFCVECNRQFPSVDKYKTHLRVSAKHNKKKTITLPCPDCGKIFGRKKNLTYHYNLFHLKKTQFYCEICDKYFARPSGLRTHRENVHLKIEKVKDKICDLCGRGFSSHVVLRHHRRTHTGERPHKCPHCSAEFIQKYAMQTHMRTQHKDFCKDADRQGKRASLVPQWPDATGYFV